MINIVTCLNIFLFAAPDDNNPIIAPEPVPEDTPKAVTENTFKMMISPASTRNGPVGWVFLVKKYHVFIIFIHFALTVCKIGFCHTVIV